MKVMLVKHCIGYENSIKEVKLLMCRDLEGGGGWRAAAVNGSGKRRSVM